MLFGFFGNRFLKARKQIEEVDLGKTFFWYQEGTDCSWRGMGRESFVDVLIGSASEVVVLNRVYIFFFVHLILISILRFISLLCLFVFFVLVMF